MEAPVGSITEMRGHAGQLYDQGLSRKLACETLKRTYPHISPLTIAAAVGALYGPPREALKVLDTLLAPEPIDTVLKSHYPRPEHRAPDNADRDYWKRQVIERKAV